MKDEIKPWRLITSGIIVLTGLWLVNHEWLVNLILSSAIVITVSILVWLRLRQEIESWRLPHRN